MSCRMTLTVTWSLDISEYISANQIRAFDDSISKLLPSPDHEMLSTSTMLVCEAKSWDFTTHRFLADRDRRSCATDQALLLERSHVHACAARIVFEDLEYFVQECFAV
jgi:hypothetical protein